MLLTSTGDVIWWWKEYFENLLSPTNTSFIEASEPVDFEVVSSITVAEVTEVVKKLHSSRAPGVDEIRPEFLKALGLSWLTLLCNIGLKSGAGRLD